MTPPIEVLTPSELSAFYTPATTAACLASWAIRSGRERVLEPSFGGGALIDAAVARATSLSGSAIIDLVGFDVDRAAVRAMDDSHGAAHRLILGDFLESDPEGYGSFDVVLVNRR